MKKRILTVFAVATLAALTACAGLQLAATQGGHPPLSEQEMLIACSDCHRTTTPSVYNEWYDSTHGIGNVKCYQCHGTYENLQVTPDMSQTCGSCHADKLGEHTGDQSCWECHTVHSFLAQ